MSTHNKQEGITLLVTLLLMGVLLSISAALLSVTLKQYQLSGLTLASEVAFQSANAGMECFLYHDLGSGLRPFDVPDDPDDEQSSNPNINCMNIVSTRTDRSNGAYTDPASNGFSRSGGEQQYLFNWVSTAGCTEVSIYKFVENTSVTVNNQPLWDGPGSTCPTGSTCTVVKSRGYNVPCAERGSSARAVERELTQIY